MKLIKKLDIRIDKNGYKRRWGLFWCAGCLQEIERQLNNGKRQKYCGSAQCVGKKGNFKHGSKGTKIYNIWVNMKDRCSNLKHVYYKDYGNRGITVCDEWLDKGTGFIKFRDWALNNGYKEGLQINRINNDGNYEPSNCNFVPSEENMRNRRGQKIKNIEMSNEIRALYATGNYTQKELAIKYNTSQVAISQIINNKIWRNK